MSAVVTFGEIMLRLSPTGFDRFVQSDTFGAVYGGGEANVALSLSNYGLDARFVSKVPAHEIGQSAVNSLRRYGVDTRFMVRGGNRLGIYFLEKGASQRPSKVIYDRANSSIAQAVPEDFDWDAIFDGADWFHFSGITPAIGGNMAEITAQAAREAHARGLTVSCDLNYRSKMWSIEEAKACMTGLMENVDVLIANEMQTEMLGVDLSKYETEDTNLTHESCTAVSKLLCEKYGFQAVALSQRRSLSADENRFKGAFYQDGESAFAPQYTIRMVDRVGSGDSFASGIIYGMKTGLTPKQTIDFATAACTLKHSVNGDSNLMSTDEIWALAGGEGSGSVQR